MNLTPQEEADRLIEQYLMVLFQTSYSKMIEDKVWFDESVKLSTQCALNDVQNTIDVLGRAQGENGYVSIANELIEQNKVLAILKNKLK